jgi:hypothetical protein
MNKNKNPDLQPEQRSRRKMSPGTLSGSELSEKDYFIECQKRNPDFIAARRDLEKRRQNLFPDENIRLSEFNAQQMAWFEDLINSWWDRPGPLLLENHDYPDSDSPAAVIFQPKVPPSLLPK